MRILHISDLHIGKEGDVDRWKKAEKIVRETIREWGDDDDKPLVLITGDVVDDGAEVEFIEARRILRPLHRAGFQVAPLPGNHDYGWNGAHAEEKRFKLFKKYLLGIETRVTYPDVPYADKDVALITLNSMHAETGFWDGLLADGELGARQLDELDELITTLRDERKKSYRIVVALHHHPFQFPDDPPLKKIKERLGHRLKDGDDLMKLLSGRIDALLFGHEHRHVDFSEPFDGHLFTEEYDIPCILSSGRSTDPGLPARVITIGGRRKVRVEPAPWSTGAG
jgi:3',5'-cyclic AMP phosphodiesterase CpdA